MTKVTLKTEKCPNCEVAIKWEEIPGKVTALQDMVSDLKETDKKNELNLENVNIITAKDFNGLLRSRREF